MGIVIALVIIGGIAILVLVGRLINAAYIVDLREDVSRLKHLSRDTVRNTRERQIEKLYEDSAAARKAIESLVEYLGVEFKTETKSGFVKKEKNKQEMIKELLNKK